MLEQYQNNHRAFRRTRKRTRFTLWTAFHVSTICIGTRGIGVWVGRHTSTLCQRFNRRSHRGRIRGQRSRMNPGEVCSCFLAVSCCGSLKKFLQSVLSVFWRHRTKLIGLGIRSSLYLECLLLESALNDANVEFTRDFPLCGLDDDRTFSLNGRFFLLFFLCFSCVVFVPRCSGFEDQIYIEKKSFALST